MTLKYSRVSHNQLEKIFFLFKEVFNKEISLKFYNKRYFLNGKYNAFIVKDNDLIIGHVGFVKNMISNNIFYVFSRHSSMIKKDYRKKNVYTSLCRFAYKSLYSKNLLGIIIFPNYINQIASEKKFSIKYFNTKYLYYYTNNSFLLNNVSSKTINKKIILKMLKIKKTNDFFFKKIRYFKKIYLNQQNKIFYYEKDGIIFFYNKIINKKILNYNILETSHSYSNCESILRSFVNSFSLPNSKINIWIDDFIELNKVVKNIGFKNSKLFFNIGLIISNKILYEKIYDKTNIEFSMGDTDVFYDIN